MGPWLICTTLDRPVAPTVAVAASRNVAGESSGVSYSVPDRPVARTAPVVASRSVAGEAARAAAETPSWESRKSVLSKLQ